jgi:hypothetical protein
VVVELTKGASLYALLEVAPFLICRGMKTIQMNLKLQTLAVVLAALAIHSSSLAQTDSTAAAKDSKTWAIVIGISKYPKVPGGQQLQFADRDAIMFAEAIRKGGVKPENTRLLTGRGVRHGSYLLFRSRRP